jgi:hypothetical protein
MVWSERGGPPVTDPARREFGARLIEHSVAQDLCGEARLSFDPPRVICTVDVTLREVIASVKIDVVPVGLRLAPGLFPAARERPLEWHRSRHARPFRTALPDRHRWARASGRARRGGGTEASGRRQTRGAGAESARAWLRSGPAPGDVLRRGGRLRSISISDGDRGHIHGRVPGR